MRALEAILRQPWAIQSEWLTTIKQIAQRAGENPEAVAARLGRPLDNTRAVQVRDGVAILPINGPIFPRANLLEQISGATSLEILALDFNEALDDPNIRALLIDFDTPGGVAFGIGEFADMIFEARQRKPVTAFVSGLAASAGYWLASAAGEVVIHETALVGSIGVVQAMHTQEQPDRDGFLEHEIVSSSAANKRPDPRTDEGRAEIVRVLDGLEKTFIAAVARNRGVTEATVVADFGRGGVLQGAEAVAAGMADRLGTFEQTLAELANRGGGAGTVQLKGTGSMSTQAENEPATESAAQPVTLESVTTDHPDIAQALRAEGATAERERILGIEANALPGHGDLIARLKADGETSPDRAAAMILAAEKEKGPRVLKSLRDTETEVEKVAPAPSAEPTSQPSTPDSKQLAAAAREIVEKEAAAGRKISVTAAMRRVRNGETAA